MTEETTQNKMNPVSEILAIIFGFGIAVCKTYLLCLLIVTSAIVEVVFAIIYGVCHTLLEIFRMFKRNKKDEPQKEEQVVEPEPTSDTLERLQTVMEECPSDWRENAKWRQDNRRWLRVSGLIANHILDYIDKSGMSADEVESDIEQKVGIGKDTFSDMLKGRHNYTLDDIAKLEEYLNIQIFDKITKL